MKHLPDCRSVRPFLSHRPGFTLVELLVVISIIALLVAILLPALARARTVAQLTLCKNHLRQTGIMMLAYVDENKGQIPSGWNTQELYDSLESWPYPGLLNQYAGHTVRYNMQFMGMGLLYRVGLAGNAQTLYCPRISPERWGGYRHATRGWNTTGGSEPTLRYSVGSYFYRYVARHSSLVAMNGGRYDDLLMRGYNAALWDSYNITPANASGEHHPEGYNVLMYQGHVTMVAADRIRELTPSIYLNYPAITQGSEGVNIDSSAVLPIFDAAGQ